MAIQYVPYTGLRVSRAEAKARAINRYFLGADKTCRRGHVSQRKTIDGKCLQCTRVGSMDATQIEAKRLRTKTWDKAHPEQNAIRTARWRQKHGVRAVILQKANHAATKTIRSRRAKEWALANSDKRRASQHGYRARSNRAEGSHTADDVKALFVKQRGRCIYCTKSLRSAYHVDHIRPLSKGGSNWPDNLQLTCAGCNVRKGHTDPIKYAQRIGRLV